MKTRKNLLVAVVVTVIVSGALVVWVVPPEWWPGYSAFGAPFSFGAAGDYGFSGDAHSVMAEMGASGLAFAIGLGDFSYGSTSESNWCNRFESHMGDGRVLLITGNHDAGESGGGNINTYRQYCNFGIAATLTGDYGKEYYFDYPQSGPLARFILTACGVALEHDGQGKWYCNAGDSHYNFVANAIDGARGAGIPYVIVGMHKNCITNGVKDCSLGEAFQDLLLSKKVDLVLQAHDHNYQRSHQLTCADDNNFRPECVADTDDDHQHGDGEVLHVVGTGGQGTYSTGGRADEPYFKTWSSSTKGFLKVDVSADAMNVAFKNVVGGYTDAYRIVRAPAGPDFALSADPSSVSFGAGQQASSTVRVTPSGGFTGTIALSAASSPSGITTTCVPSSITESQTSSCTLGSSTAGSYTVTITGTSGTLTRMTSIAATVTTVGPTARFSYSPILPKVNQPVTFDASASTDTDPSATLQARWDWENDGTWDTPYSTSLIAQTTYATPGARTVTLEILDSHGFKGTATAVVHVLDLEEDREGIGAPPGYGLTDPSRLEARAPIYIGSNAAFTATNGVRSGTGTAADPYVIRDWFIDGSLYPGSQAMIHIEFTNAYVIIENNKIVNLAGSNHWEAIQLGHWPATVDTQHVTIRHNHIENARHAYGIAVREGSRDIRVEANFVQTDANYDQVYGIMTDRGVHDVTIFGNYVNAYTSGTFRTSGIHLSDIHVDDARRATGLVAARNTVVNATAAAIESLSSTGTVISGNLVYTDHPGAPIAVGSPRGIEMAWNSVGTIVVGNIIHTFASGIVLGSDDGDISSNTIFGVEYGVFVPDNGSMPGVSVFGGKIYNLSMWDVSRGAVRLPARFGGTVVDLGPGIRSGDLSSVFFSTDRAASRVALSWAGLAVNVSATVDGTVLFDTAAAQESQTLEAVWTGSITKLTWSAVSPQRAAFHLGSPGDVRLEGTGFVKGVPYRLMRTTPSGASEVLAVQSSAAGALSVTVPAAEPSDYEVTTDAAPDGGPGFPGFPDIPVIPWLPDPLRSLPFFLGLFALLPLIACLILVRRRRRRRSRRPSRSRATASAPRRRGTTPRARPPPRAATRRGDLSDLDDEAEGDTRLW